MSKEQRETIEKIVQAFADDDFSTVADLCPPLLLTIATEQRQQLSLVYLHALIELEQLDVALDWISKQEEVQQQTKDMQLYCWYKQQQYAQVLAATENDKTTRAAACIRAQSLFHMGRTTEAADAFQALTTQTTDEERVRVWTNVVSAWSANAVPYCGAEYPVDAVVQLLEEESNYDLAFSLASLQLVTGNSSRDDAFARLDQAARTCHQENNDDETTAQQELAPIEINRRVFRCLYELLPITNDTVAGKDVAAPLQAVERVNRSILGSHANDAIALHLLSKDVPHTKWTPLQKRCYTYDLAVAQYRNQKYKECRVTCRGIKKESNSLFWGSRVAVLLAYCAAADGKASADEILQEFVTKVEADTPSSSENQQALIYTLLHRAQLQGEDPLVTLTETLPAPLRSLPAVVSGTAALYRAQGSNDKADALLGNDPDAWMVAGRYEEAAAMYEKAIVEGDLESTARWVRALSYFNPTKAREEWAKVKPSTTSNTDEGSSPVSGEELEARELPVVKQLHSTKSRTTAVELPAVSQKTNKKSRAAVLRYRAKKRADYLASLERRGRRIQQQPDPERWLPKHSRGAQGGLSTKEAAKWDVVARQNAGPSALPSTAHLSVKGSHKGGKRR